MSDRDTTTIQSFATTTRWDFLSGLDEQRQLPLPEFCRMLCRRFVETGEVAACGLWRIDRSSGRAALIVDQALSSSPLLTDPPAAEAHQQWLRNWIGQRFGGAADTPESRGIALAGWQVDVIPVDSGGTAVVLETVRQEPADSAESGFAELLEEVARQLRQRWQSTTGRQPESLPTPATAIPPLDEAADRVRPRSGNGQKFQPPLEQPQSPTYRDLASDVEASATDQVDRLLPKTPEPFQTSDTAQTDTSPAQPGSPTPPAIDWQDLWQLSLRLQQSLSTREVADTAANDGRVWLNCDRVTILVGRRPRIVAVSGVSRWSRRSPWVSRLEMLVRRVVAGKMPLEFPNDVDQLPPEIERPLADYLAEAQSRGLIVAPLTVCTPPDPESDRSPLPPKLVGCLVAEHLLAGHVLPGFAERVRLLGDCLARPLDNAVNYDAIFLRPVWRTIGRTWQWFKGRRLALAISLILLVAATTTGLILVPWEYRVEADGQFLPAQRQDIFVPSDSEVHDILVRDGEQVSAGQLLVVLKDAELQAELVGARTDLDEQRQRYRALQFQIDQSLRAGQRDAELQYFGQLEETRALIAGLVRKIGILERRAEQLEVRAPVAGTVATFQVEQLLRHRPVQRGDVLMTLMQADGPWQLELDLEESRLGHLIQARREPTTVLPVEYVTVTAPEIHYAATLQYVATRATLAEDDRLIVRLIAHPAEREHPVRRIGAEVRARIACGPKPLGYVLFGDVIEFVQRYVWW